MIAAARAFLLDMTDSASVAAMAEDVLLAAFSADPQFCSKDRASAQEAREPVE